MSGHSDLHRGFDLKTARSSVPLAVPVGLVTAVAVVSTTGVGSQLSWFDEQRGVLLSVLAVLAIVSRLLSPSGSSRFAGPIVVVLGFGLLSSVLALRGYAALLDWTIYCLMASLILNAPVAKPSMIEVAAVLFAVVVPSAYAAGVVANYVSALLLDLPVGADTLLVGFSNPRFPAQLQVLTLPLLPLALEKAPSTFWKSCAAVVGSLWWMCFIGSGSRTGWIAIAAVACVVPWVGVEGRKWFKTQLAFAVGGGLLWILLFHVLPSLLGMTTANESGRFSDFNSVSARWELWRLAFEMALSHPILGVGPMHFAYVDNGYGAHPHNFWLQLAAEWGIPAALLTSGLVLALVIGLWRAAVNAGECECPRTGVALLAAVLGWCIGTLADGYLVVPTSQAMTTGLLVLAVMWLRLTTPTVTVPASGTRLASRMGLLFLAVAVAALAALPLTEFGQVNRREQAWRAEHPGQWLWPRFWQQGWIGPESDPTAR